MPVNRRSQRKQFGTRSARGVRIVERPKDDDLVEEKSVSVSEFASRRGAESRVVGGYYGHDRAWNPACRSSLPSGAPAAKPRPGNRGDRLVMGWLDKSHAIAAGLCPEYETEVIYTVARGRITLIEDLRKR